MTEAKRVGKAPAIVGLIGATALITGLIARARAITAERDRAYTARLFNDLAGTTGGDELDYSDANMWFWVVGIGVALLLVSLTVYLVRRP